MEVQVFLHDRSNRPDQRQATRRAPLGGALVCAMIAMMLVAVARPAAAQQRAAAAPKAAAPATTSPATPATPTPAASVIASEIVCDSVAAPTAPRKVAAVRPRKARKPRVAPRVAPHVAAAPAAPKAKRSLAVAHARKRSPTKGSAAGHRAAAPVAAKATTPPRCHSAAAVAATPDVGAVANLVSSLPWTTPVADATFPVASAPTLAEIGGIGLRTGGTLAAGLLGAGAFWLKSGSGGEESSSVVPPEGPGGPGGPETPGGPNGPPPITTVPEPATLALVASGLAAIGARTRRRRTR